jgi:hypothetical protein
MTFHKRTVASLFSLAAACSSAAAVAAAPDRAELETQRRTLTTAVMTELVIDRGALSQWEAARCGVAARWHSYASDWVEKYVVYAQIDAQEKAAATAYLVAMWREHKSRPFKFLMIFMVAEHEDDMRAAQRADIERSTFGAAGLEGVPVTTLHAKAREVLDDCTLRTLEKLGGMPAGAYAADDAPDRGAFELTVWRAMTRVMTQLAIDRNLPTPQASARCAAAEGWETIAMHRLIRSVKRGDVPPGPLDVLTAEMRSRPFLFERFVQAYVPDPAARRGLLADRAQDAFGVRDANKVRDGVLMPEMRAVLDDCTADLLEKLSRAE